MRARDVLAARAAGLVRLGRRRPVLSLVAGTALVLGAALLLWGIFSGPGPLEAGRSADGIGGDYVVTRYGPGIRLRRSSFLWSFHRRGRLESLDSKSIASRTRGTIKRIWEEGKPVKKGDVVFEMDTRDVEEEIAEHEAELRVRKAVLVQTERRHAKSVKQAELAVRRGELDLEWERLNEKLLLSGPTTTEAARAKADLKTRDLVARNRREELRILEELGRRGFATPAEVGRKRLQLTEARLEFEKASAALKRLLAGPDEPERKEARLSVEIAEYALESARKELESVKAMAAGAVMREEKLVNREEDGLRRERSYLAKHVVRAPADGFVIHLPAHWGGTWRPGNRLWHGTRVMSMPVGSRLKAVTKVSPSEIGLVKVGMKCFVAVAGALRLAQDAGTELVEGAGALRLAQDTGAAAGSDSSGPDLPAASPLLHSARPPSAGPEVEHDGRAVRGGLYDGEVIAAGSQGRDEFAELDSYTSKLVGKSGRRAFAVEVKIADETPELRPGMHADVEFIVKEMDGVLAVPWGAVTRGPEGASLTVIEKGRPVGREVELGASTRHAVVIASGCKEGEVVLLAGEMAGPVARRGPSRGTAAKVDASAGQGPSRETPREPERRRGGPTSGRRRPGGRSGRPGGSR